MSDHFSPGSLKGKVVEQRAKLRRNLVNRLFRLGNAIQTQTQHLLAQNSDLSVVHFRILLRLRQAGTQNVQGISELLGANRSLVSRALPDLRDRGWIELVKSETDKRQILVRLTEEGERVVDQHGGPIKARYDAIQSAFTAEELDQLVDFLDRLDIITNASAGDFQPSDSPEETGEIHE
jgi:DNA-binding MarR family transcriptional regulator